MHRAGNEIGQSNKICHKTCLWTLVHLCWSALLLQTAGVHDSNAVRERESFFLVMGHVDKRDTNRALQRLQFGLHLLAKLEVQCAERLVKQQHSGSIDEGASQGNPLLLPT